MKWIEGIGRSQFDNSFSRPRRPPAKGTIDMGNLASAAFNPMAPGFSFTMGMLGHGAA